MFASEAGTRTHIQDMYILRNSRVQYRMGCQEAGVVGEYVGDAERVVTCINNEFLLISKMPSGG